MDPLRGQIRNLLDTYGDSVVLEADDLVNLLDGREEIVLRKHDEEQKKFSLTKGNVEQPKGKPTNPRQDMVEDKKIDEPQTTTIEMAIQLITAFEQSYDKQTVKDINKLRKSKAFESKSRVQAYDEAKKVVKELRKEFDL